MQTFIPFKRPTLGAGAPLAAFLYQTAIVQVLFKFYLGFSLFKSRDVMINHVICLCNWVYNWA